MVPSLLPLIVELVVGLEEDSEVVDGERLGETITY